jgi:hypothetical protein
VCRFDGQLITPKSLNVWLLANKGYHCAAGSISVQQFLPSPANPHFSQAT